jgi:hypothetical protein
MHVCCSFEILHEVSEEVLAGWSEVQVDVGCDTASCIDDKASKIKGKKNATNLIFLKEKGIISLLDRTLVFLFCLNI